MNSGKVNMRMFNFSQMIEEPSTRTSLSSVKQRKDRYSKRLGNLTMNNI